MTDECKSMASSGLRPATNSRPDRPARDLPLRLGLLVAVVFTGIFVALLAWPVRKQQKAKSDPPKPAVSAARPEPPSPTWSADTIRSTAEDLLARWAALHEQRDQAGIEALYDDSFVGVAIDAQGKEQRVERSAWLSLRRDEQARLALVTIDNRSVEIDERLRLAKVHVEQQLLDGRHELGRKCILSIAVAPKPRIVEERATQLLPGWNVGRGLESDPTPPGCDASLDLGKGRWFVVSGEFGNYEDAYRAAVKIRQRKGDAEITHGAALGLANQFMVVIGVFADEAKARRRAGRKGKVIDTLAGQTPLPGWDLEEVATQTLPGVAPVIVKDGQLTLAIREPEGPPRLLAWRLSPDLSILISVQQLPDHSEPWRAFNLLTGERRPLADAFDRPYDLPGKEAVVGSRRYRVDAATDSLVAVEAGSELWRIPMHSAHMLVQVFPWKKGIVLRRGRALMFFKPAATSVRRFGKLCASIDGLSDATFYFDDDARLAAFVEEPEEEDRDVFYVPEPETQDKTEPAIDTFEIWQSIPKVVGHELATDKNCAHADSVLLADLPAFITLNGRCAQGE